MSYSDTPAEIRKLVDDDENRSSDEYKILLSIGSIKSFLLTLEVVGNASKDIESIQSSNNVPHVGSLQTDKQNILQEVKQVVNSSQVLRKKL